MVLGNIQYVYAKVETLIKKSMGDLAESLKKKKIH